MPEQTAVLAISDSLVEREPNMRKWVHLAALGICMAGPAGAQTTERSISLKAGETADVGTAYFVVNCRSLLKGEPTLDVMEAPPDVSVTLRKEKVVPRSLNCSQPVPGGTLVIAAPKELKARTDGRLTVRVNYTTLDGKRQSTREFHLVLFPGQINAGQGTQPNGDQQK